MLWVDLAAPSIPESLILSDTFAFHPLSVEDAMSDAAVPEDRGLRRLPVRHPARHRLPARAEQGFATHDVDFFLGRNYLVTVHDGHSRSIAELRDHVRATSKILGEGPVALFHRIVRRDGRSLPAGGRASSRSGSTSSRTRCSSSPSPDLMREILDQKRDVSSLRRVVDAAARRHRPAGPPRVRRTSAPRCPSASATSTTTWSASTDEAFVFRTGSPASSTRTCRTPATG